MAYHFYQIKERIIKKTYWFTFNEMEEHSPEISQCLRVIVIVFVIIPNLLLCTNHGIIDLKEGTK